MSFDDRLRHTLVIRRMTAGGGVDEYGQPVSAPGTFATVPGLIQPRKATEVALLSQAGAVVSDHIGYIRPLAGLTTADWIELDGTRYDITMIADAGGQGHHLELGLKQVA